MTLEEFQKNSNYWFMWLSNMRRMHDELVTNNPNRLDRRISFEFDQLFVKDVKP